MSAHQRVSNLCRAFCVIPLVFTLFACGSTPPGRQLGGQVSVSTWYQERKSALSLTFDDAMADQDTYVRPMLAKYGFKGTFYLNTGLVESGVFHFGTWDQFARILADGHEIGSHTITHPYLTRLSEGSEAQEGTVLYELAGSRAQINRHFPSERCLTFAYPYCDENKAINSLVARYYIAARSGRFNANTPVWNDPVPADWMGLISYAPQFPDVRTSEADDLPELRNVQQLLSLSVNRGTWAILMIHSVVPFGMISTYSGWQVISTSWFDALCAWIQGNVEDASLWVDTVAHVTRYARERESVQIAMESNTEGEISFSLSDDLDNAVFDFPLTMNVRVPGSWTGAQLTRADGTTEDLSINEDAAALVRFDAAPDSGVLILRPQNM